MRDMLDSSLLRCFLAVFEHRKLTVAASHLCLTQPALSKRLRRLEEELGVALFERSPGGMVPTPYGIALARRAHAIELESRRARSELQVLQEGGVGSVTIGTGPLWSVHALPEVIGRLARQHSQLRVRVIPGVLDTLLPQLLKGELDVVCAALDFPDQPGLVKERLIDSDHVIIAHHSHPLAGSPNVSPEELRTCAFVGLHNDYAVLERMDRFFSLRGLVSPGFAAEAGSLELLLSLVGTGAFVASQSHQVLERAGLLGIRQLAGDCSFWHFAGGLVYREGALTASARLFCNAMREHSATAPAA